MRNQKGIALMIVLAAITLLTATATEFAYSTNVNYNLALNDKERLQAYFLAGSAIKLMELELKLEKQLRTNVANSQVGQMLSGNMAGPLCQQFPLSTGLIRSMFMGQIPDSEEGAEGVEEEGSPAAFVSGMQVEAAEEFLNFEGDFEGTCADESAKFNLNMFSGKDPAQEVMSGYNSYDKSKQMLEALLSRPEYKKLFPEDSSDKLREISRNIADWIDTNDRMNELGGSSTGSENSLYPTGVSAYSVKNGKFLSLEEVYLVADVLDEWFNPIKNNFTVYGGDKVNVCIAPDEMVSAVITQYITSDSAITGINVNDKDRMKQFVDIVKQGCAGMKPNVNDIANSLKSALGLADNAKTTTNFADLITTESRYYSLIGTGFVRDSVVKITAVLDTKESQPSRWKFVYWRVE